MPKLPVLLTLLIAPMALADDSPDAVVKYRHTVMEGLSKHMKASVMVVKGQVARQKDLEGHARALHAASQTLPEWFPKGTGPDKIKSDSLPAVWDDWDGFVAANDKFKTETGKLVTLAEKGDYAAFGTQLMAVGKSCGECHDKYRVDED